MCGCPGGNAAPASEQRLAMECCGPRTELFCPCRDGPTDPIDFFDPVTPVTSHELHNSTDPNDPTWPH